MTLSIGLTAGCFLVRANTFLWLAPIIVLGIIVGWPGVDARLRSAAVALGLVGLVAIYALISWRPLWSNPTQFLFGYVEFVHQSNEPTYVDGLYQELTKSLGRSGAGMVGTALTLIGTMGPWLPALLISAGLAHRLGRLEAIDALPFILLVVATISILIAPPARHGDISEFRHRAGPLLVLVTLVWSLRFAAIAAAPELERWSIRSRRIALIGLATLSIGALGLAIGPLKQPRMAWGARYYGSRVAPELATLAPLRPRRGRGQGPLRDGRPALRLVQHRRRRSLCRAQWRASLHFLSGISPDVRTVPSRTRRGAALLRCVASRTRQISKRSKAICAPRALPTMLSRPREMHHSILKGGARSGA